jgi:peptidyl-prolyl cis-trans isomerase D
VRDRLIASRSAELAKKDGTEKLAAWKAVAPTSLPAAVIVSREQGQTIQGPVLDAALRADVSSLPGWVGVDLGAQGYAVLRVNKVLPRTAVAPERAAQERKQYTQWMASAENQAYYKMLQDRFKVQIKVPRPARSSTDLRTAVE